MLYFVKDGTLHQFPVAERCKAQRDKEKLRDTIPYDVEQCSYCLGRWPDRGKKA